MFKYASTQIIKNIKPVLITDINDIEKTTGDLTKIYNQKLTPLVDYIKKEMLTEQQKLDNPANYRFESTLCPWYQAASPFKTASKKLSIPL